MWRRVLATAEGAKDGSTSACAGDIEGPGMRSSALEA
jgi:hypothetical protein